MLCKFDVDSVRLFKCVQLVVGSSLIGYGCEKIHVLPPVSRQCLVVSSGLCG